MSEKSEEEPEEVQDSLGTFLDISTLVSGGAGLIFFYETAKYVTLT